MHALVPKVVYLADCATRVDLHEQSIADERAYVAAWLARVRDMWKAQGAPSYFAARHPDQGEEVANGIDAILVIQIDDLYKAVGIEAKRPGLGTARVWDNTLPAPKLSRFHNQLNKQSYLASKGWAMGAMFINEICPGAIGPAGTDKHGASFMDQAQLLAASNAIVAGPPHHWKTSNLLPLMTLGLTHNLENLLESVIACKSGSAMSKSQLLESAAASAVRLADEETTPRDPEEDLDEPDPGAHPNTVLLRNLCRYTGASSAVLMDASGPWPEEVDVRPRWRESSLQRTLKPATGTATTGPRLRF